MSDVPATAPDATSDIARALRAWRLWTLLGWLDVRQRYARSTLGPLWITIAMGITVGSIALVYGALLHQPMGDYLPWLGTGFVAWSLVAGILNDACASYSASSRYILNTDVGLWTYVLQVVWRQLIFFVHNLAIAGVLAAVFPQHLSWNVLLAVAGVALVALNLAWMASLVALAATRFRDVTQLVAAAVQILFYVTPLMWRPEMLHDARWLIAVNPFHAFVDLVRAPLLGERPEASSWAMAAALIPFGCAAAWWLQRRYGRRVAYWL